MKRIWLEDEYATMRHELLRLMMRFQLCYELPEGSAFIAPQLLSPTQPSYVWDPAGNLILVYEYHFMPKGLITRVIVALNHLIADQQLVWRSGVVLSRDGTRAEIVEDYPHRKISIRVAGPDTRGLLSIVDDQLERIHRSFAHLKYEKFLPCNCSICSTRTDPFTYPLSELKDFARTGDAIQCRISRKLVDAAELIRDVFPAAVRLVEHENVVRQQPVSVTPTDRKEVFVSYKWTDVSKAIVDDIEKQLSASGIALIWDKNEVKYKDSITGFMERIGRGKCIVTILSKGYLESKNCMFELTEIAQNKGIRDRVFPIILSDANIYEAAGRLDYIAFWEKKIEELDANMKKVRGENLSGIREELDLFARIRSVIADILDILADMNTLTLDRHQGSSFQELIRKLEERLVT